MAASLFAPLAVPPGGEASEPLALGEGIRVERIVSAGHASPEGFWYDQDGPEFVALLQGTATLAFADGTEQRIGTGEWLLIPAHRRHRVAATSAAPPAVWLAVHYRA
jgi:cupin 2 domain-containing protein